ncbi:MAG: hypothetical protein ACJ768_25535 [Gaiellaceae bacterium]
MTDPRTDRIADLAAALTALPPVEPLPVRLARRAHQAARADLAAQLAAGAPQRIVDALRYRVERTADLLDQRWAQTLG